MVGLGTILLFVAPLLFLAGIRIVRPTHRGLIERLGKYHRFANPGFQWIFPIVENIYIVNITEQMVDAEPQEIITNDNLNARVDAQVYFKVKDDAESGCAQPGRTGNRRDPRDRRGSAENDRVLARPRGKFAAILEETQ